MKMNEAIQSKMDEWIVKEDDVSMFKFASILFITAPKEEEPGLQEILNHAEQLASGLDDVELARAKKEIKQLLNEENNND
jgi:3-methyladenine DNA glycosylase AlkD